MSILLPLDRFGILLMKVPCNRLNSATEQTLLKEFVHQLTNYLIQLFNMSLYGRRTTLHDCISYIRYFILLSLIFQTKQHGSFKQKSSSFFCILARFYFVHVHISATS